MMKLYPLHFKTIFKEKIWGGDKITDLLGKNLPSDLKYGESWELSAVSGNVSVVDSGPLKGQDLRSLVSTFKEELVGNKNYKRFGDQFPLLIKFLDADDDLSVQVHPDDAYAKEHNGPDAQGKSEMWYIMEADENSEIILGFSQDVDRNKFIERVKTSRLEEVLNKEEVSKGDVFYVPPGRIHNIGKGMMIAEVQQTSDITYRIYDFDRIDKDGNKRELHLERAADVLDYEVKDNLRTHYDNKEAKAKLVDNEFFTVNKHNHSKPKTIDYATLDSFVILIGITGILDCKVEDDTFKLKKGDVYLLPAITQTLEILSSGKGEYLEVFIR